MAETAAREARCDFSDLVVTQCSHCRPPVPEPVRIDFVGIWDGTGDQSAGGRRPSGRGAHSLHDDAVERSLFYSRLRGENTLRRLGYQPDTLVDDHLEDFE